MTMTREDYRNAARETLRLAADNGMVDLTSDSPDADYPHLEEMVQKMETDDTMSLEKLGRWIGWIQACVYINSMGGTTLDDFKAINMRNSDNAR